MTDKRFSRRIVLLSSALSVATVAVGAVRASAQVSTVTESSSTPTAGQSLTTVAHDTGTSTGVVEFLINDPDDLCVVDSLVNASNGSATLTWTPQKSGTYTITATDTDMTTGKAVGTSLQSTLVVGNATSGSGAGSSVFSGASGSASGVTSGSSSGSG